jgi:hypothetical protein
VAWVTYHGNCHRPVVHTKGPIANSGVDTETVCDIRDDSEGNDSTGELRRMISVDRHVATMRKQSSQQQKGPRKRISASKYKRLK